MSFLERLPIRLRAIGILVCVSALFGGCTSYTYAKNFKLMSYDNNVQTGNAVGPVRGADCTWSLLGYALGGEPTLDRAVTNARTRTGENALDATKEADESKALRYMNNVTTEWDGFNAVIVGKKCLIVKGTGYK